MLDAVKDRAQSLETEVRTFWRSGIRCAQKIGVFWGAAPWPRPLCPSGPPLLGAGMLPELLFERALRRGQASRQQPER